jgi:hypothetical protein
MDKPRGIQRRQTHRPSSVDAFINDADGAGTNVLDEALVALSSTEKQERERVVTFNLRLPESVHARLEAVAKGTGKSMHEVAMTLFLAGLQKAYERFAK